MAKQWKRSLEKTDIVSDGTAFPGANIDGKISNAGASQTDIQNAILSDGTPFDGANIDAPISGSGRASEYIEIGSNGDTTVNGSGYLTWLAPERDTDPGNDLIGLNIELDGTTLLNTRFFYRWESGYSPWARFENSLFVSETEGERGVRMSVLLD